MLAVALTSLGIIGAFVALTVYLVRRGDVRADKVQSLTERLADRQVKNAELNSALDRRDKVIDDMLADAGRLKRTLSVVERQRDNAITELVNLNDPAGVAAGINSELSTLRDLFGHGAPAPKDPDDP